MAENWAAVGAEVAKEIKELGVASQLVKPPSSGPAYPSDTTPVVPSAPQTVYFVPSNERKRDNTGNLGETFRDRLLVAATGVVPETGDLIMVKGVLREIQEVQTLWQGGMDLLYKVQLVLT